MTNDRIHRRLGGWDGSGLSYFGVLGTWIRGFAALALVRGRKPGRLVKYLKTKNLRRGRRGSEFAGTPPGMRVPAPTSGKQGHPRFWRSVGAATRERVTAPTLRQNTLGCAQGPRRRRGWAALAESGSKPHPPNAIPVDPLHPRPIQRLKSTGSSIGTNTPAGARAEGQGWNRMIFRVPPAPWAWTGPPARTAPRPAWRWWAPAGPAAWRPSWPACRPAGSPPPPG